MTLPGRPTSSRILDGKEHCALFPTCKGDNHYARSGRGAWGGGGGYGAEVPVIPSCATEGEIFEELLHILYEAVEGCLVVHVQALKATSRDRVVEIAV